jgi:hypothetical protein
MANSYLLTRKQKDGEDELIDLNKTAENKTGDPEVKHCKDGLRRARRDLSSLGGSCDLGLIFSVLGSAKIATHARLPKHQRPLNTAPTAILRIRDARLGGLRWAVNVIACQSQVACRQLKPFSNVALPVRAEPQ